MENLFLEIKFKSPIVTILQTHPDSPKFEFVFRWNYQTLIFSYQYKTFCKIYQVTLPKKAIHTFVELSFLFFIFQIISKNQFKSSIVNLWSKFQIFSKSKVSSFLQNFSNILVNILFFITTQSLLWVIQISFFIIHWWIKLVSLRSKPKELGYNPCVWWA